MPAKKTFNSIRVRGAVRFDSHPTSKGIAMPLYRHYVAHVWYEGGELQEVIVYENTLGGSPVVSVTGDGVIEVMLAGAFTLNKTLCFVNLLAHNISNEALVRVSPISDSAVRLEILSNAGAHVTDGICEIEIRVYPS
jgi:hypothetical protein